MKTMLIVLVACALTCSLAIATPTALTSSQMDTVVAGQSVLDTFVGDVTPQQDNTIINAGAFDNAVAFACGPDSAANANSGAIANANAVQSNATNGFANTIANGDALAISGNANALNLGDGNQAYAEDESVANQGTDNIGNYIDIDDGEENAVPAGISNFAAADNDIDADGATVMGNLNITTSAGDNDNSAIAFGVATATVDNSEVEANDWVEESYGVVARVADVSCSFNENEVESDIDADIDDSFNNTTNCMTIQDQATAQAIVLGNAYDEQNIGTNLIVTTSTSDAPTGVTSVISVPAATAITTVTQVGVNDAAVIGIGVF